MSNSVQPLNIRPISAEQLYSADNSLDLMLEALNAVLPSPLTRIIHNMAYPVKEYKIPKAVRLSTCNCIKIALCTILTLGIWLYKQHTYFRGALLSGDLKAAEEAAKNGGSLFSRFTVSGWELVQQGKVASAAFLMTQNVGDLFQMDNIDEVRGEYYAVNHFDEVFANGLDEALRNLPASRELYQDALTALLLTGCSDAILRKHFYEAIKRGDLELAQLFFKYGKTCDSLIEQYTDELFTTENVRFLIENGLKVDQGLLRNRDERCGTFLWHCVRLDNVDAARLILEAATPEQKGKILKRKTSLNEYTGTPEQIAFVIGNERMKDLLAQHSGKPPITSRLS